MEEDYIIDNINGSTRSRMSRQQASCMETYVPLVSVGLET